MLYLLTSYVDYNFRTPKLKTFVKSKVDQIYKQLYIKNKLCNINKQKEIHLNKHKL